MPKDGRDVDREFRTGARLALQILQENQVELVVLQPRSPSCGIGRIYDGTFSGTLTDGNGIATELFLGNGFHCVAPDALAAIRVE